MYWCSQGPWKGRIIFTVHHKKKLVSWTGRTIWPEATPRYLSLTRDPDRAAQMGCTPANAPIHDYLLWYDRLKKSEAETIYICEGPFDALRIAVLGRKHGIDATCLFTNHASDSQVNQLYDILPRFNHRYILLDGEKRMLPISLRMQSELSPLGVASKLLPPRINDPAELTEELLLGLRV